MITRVKKTINLIIKMIGDEVPTLQSDLVDTWLIEVHPSAREQHLSVRTVNPLMEGLPPISTLIRIQVL
jgi:hypothetical protein